MIAVDPVTPSQEMCASLDGIATCANNNAHDKGFHETSARSVQQIRDERFPRWCMLIVSEIAEAMEAHRCHEGDERIGEELADAIIRIADTAKEMGIPLGEAVWRKMAKNAMRSAMHGGKLY